MRDVGPHDCKKTAQCNIGDKNDRAQNQAEHEPETEKTFEDEGHAPNLRDQVNDARHGHNDRAPGPEPAAVETVTHVIGNRKASRSPQLLRKQIENDGGAANERNVRKNCDATESTGERDATQNCAAVHDRRHVRHDQHTEAESPAGDPEVGFGFLLARGDQTNTDDGYQVQAENDGADGIRCQEYYPYSSLAVCAETVRSIYILFMDL